MKKTVGILVVLILSMIVAGACTEDLKGAWRCSDTGHNVELLFIGDYRCMIRDYDSDKKYVIVSSWKSVENGIEFDNETYLWVGNDLQSKKAGHLYKKQDFLVDKPAWTSVTSMDEFYGDWKLVGVRALGENFNRPAGYVLFDVQMHIDENSGLMMYIPPAKEGEETQARMYPLTNPRLEDGKLVMGAMSTGNEEIKLEINMYENGWIDTPLGFNNMEVVYLTRANSQSADVQASSESGETSGTDGSEQEEPEEAASVNRVMHTAKGGLDVKAAASRNARKVVTLKKDREVTVLGLEGDWYYIEVDLGNKKVQGYVPVDSLK